MKKHMASWRKRHSIAAPLWRALDEMEKDIKRRRNRER